MACWLEYYTCEVAIQKRVDNVWGGIVDGSRRVWQTPVYVTDDADAFNSVQFTDLNRMSVEEGNRRFNAFEALWGIKPTNIMRYGIFRDADHELTSRDQNVFGVEWFNYNELFIMPNSDISVGYNNNRVVWRTHEETWAVGADIISNWYPQTLNMPTNICTSNYTLPRQKFNWKVMLKDSNNEIQQLSWFDIIADPTGSFLHTWVHGYIPNGHDLWNFYRTHLPWNGTDPYDGVIPTTGASGGQSTGTGITPSEPVPEPDPLTASSADTGFTRIYNPSLSQLQDFAHYMWTDTNILQTVINHVKQYFEDPMDAFIALNLLPVSVPSSGSEMVRLLFIDTGKYMNVASNQFVTVELGELTINEAYGSALDYAPNTKMDLFLPYIGTVTVDTDEIMGRRVKLTYKVDICTGVCVAILKVELDIEGGKAFFPLYQFTGNCAIRIPFTSANMDGYINAGIEAAKITAGAIAGGLAGAASAAAGSVSPESNTASANAGESTSGYETASYVDSISPAATSKSIKAGIKKADAYTKASLFNVGATLARAASGAIGIVSGAKAGFPHSSGFIGNSGYMSYKVPFFIMKVPRMVNPGEYGKYNGYPSLSYQQFSALSGYAEIQQVQLTNINATANELDEIQMMLKSGVIF